MGRALEIKSTEERAFNSHTEGVLWCQGYCDVREAFLKNLDGTAPPLPPVTYIWPCQMFEARIQHLVSWREVGKCHHFWEKNYQIFPSNFVDTGLTTWSRTPHIVITRIYTNLPMDYFSSRIRLLVVVNKDFVWFSVMQTYIYSELEKIFQSKSIIISSWNFWAQYIKRKKIVRINCR